MLGRESWSRNCGERAGGRFVKVWRCRDVPASGAAAGEGEDVDGGKEKKKKGYKGGNRLGKEVAGLSHEARRVKTISEKEGYLGLEWGVLKGGQEYPRHESRGRLGLGVQRWGQESSSLTKEKKENSG